CMMYQNDNSNNDNQIQKFNYFNKLKDFIIKKFNKNCDKNIHSLFENIDTIISDEIGTEKEYENYIVSNKIYKKKEEAFWFNQLLITWFNRWKDSEIFYKGLKKYLYRIYNKKRPENLDTIFVDNVKLTGSPPFLK